MEFPKIRQAEKVILSGRGDADDLAQLGRHKNEPTQELASPRSGGQRTRFQHAAAIEEPLSELVDFL